jgi:hypothetical protein
MRLHSQERTFCIGRLPLWVLGASLAVFGAPLGCGDSDGPALEVDAGDDATVDEDASPAEDAAAGDGGSVQGLQCSDEVCVAGERCCVTTVTDSSCVADEDPCDGLRVGCFTPTDCNEDQACCIENEASSCVSPDACDGAVMCTTEDDCTDDGHECCPSGVCMPTC